MSARVDIVLCISVAVYISILQTEKILKFAFPSFFDENNLSSSWQLENLVGASNFCSFVQKWVSSVLMVKWL